jgi:predicted nucleotidyltransferase
MRMKKKEIVLVQNCNSEINDFFLSKTSILTDLLLKEINSVEAIVLEGSLGKGEGTYYQLDNRLVPLSDYDFTVVTRRPFLPPLRTYTSQDFEKLMGSHCTVLIIWKPLLRFVPPKITWYDIKFGSQTLHGNEKVLNLIPLRMSDHIPLEEGIRLLFNRILDLLAAFDLSFATERNNEHRIKLAYCCNKATLAFGECLLLLRNKWNPCASARNEMLEKEVFSESKRWSEPLLAIRNAVREATFTKLNISPKTLNEIDTRAFWFDTQKLFNSFLKYYFEKWKGEEINSDRDLIDFMLKYEPPFSPHDRMLAMLDFFTPSLSGRRRKVFEFTKNPVWLCLIVAYLLYTSVQRSAYFSLDIRRIAIAEDILKTYFPGMATYTSSSNRWSSAKAWLLEIAQFVKH